MGSVSVDTVDCDRNHNRENRTKGGKDLERETGIEPATSSLGSWRSTAELLPLNLIDFIDPSANGLRVSAAGSRSTTDDDMSVPAGTNHVIVRPQQAVGQFPSTSSLGLNDDGICLTSTPLLRLAVTRPNEKMEGQHWFFRFILSPLRFFISPSAAVRACTPFCPLVRLPPAHSSPAEFPSRQMPLGAWRACRG